MDYPISEQLVGFILTLALVAGLCWLADLYLEHKGVRHSVK